MDTRQKISLYEGFGEQVLQCPKCGGDNLHYVPVEVVNKPNDADVLMDFSCETCSENDKDPDFQLAVYTHKGSTYIGWV